MGKFADVTIGCNNPVVTAGFEGGNSGYYHANNMLTQKFTKTGSGTFALLNRSGNGNNIKDSIVIAGGTLVLKDANAISKNQPVILDGGTLAVEGLEANLLSFTGILKMTANGGGIQFMDGTTQLKFPAYTDGDWNSAGTLSIKGWQGTAEESGTAGKLFFGATDEGLGADQLNQVVFADQNYAKGMLLTTGEVVPSATLKVSVDTIVWTNAGDDADWDNYMNWNVVKDGVETAADENIILSENVCAIIPINVNNFPVLSGTPSVIKYSDDKYVSKIEVKYGASFLVESFKGKYDEVKVELLAGQDKWMLFGPNVLPNNRDMNVEDFTDANMVVELYDIEIDNAVVNWDNEITNTSNAIYPDRGVAFIVPAGDALFNWSGKFFTEEEDYEFYVDGGFAVMSNVFLADLSVNRLLSGTDDEIAVLNSDGTFDTYVSEDDTDFIIKPMQAFFYNSADSKEVTITEGDCMYNYELPTGYVRDYPMLTIKASVTGLGSSRAFFAYDGDIRNTTKLFTGTHAPDIFGYTSSANYQRQAFTSLDDSFDLGVRLAADAQVAFSVEGADEFDEAYLEDKVSEVIYDLKTDAIPALSLTAGENKNRFTVYFKEKSVGIETPAQGVSDISVYVNNKQLFVNAPAGIDFVRVSDITGNTLVQQSSVQVDMSAYPAGIYVVTVSAAGKLKAVKAIVK